MGVGILVAYASFQRSHGLLGIDGLGANGIGDLEIEGNILSTFLLIYRARKADSRGIQRILRCGFHLLLDLRRARKPARHHHSGRCVCLVVYFVGLHGKIVLYAVEIFTLKEWRMVEI